jgi:hypothetical protein
MKKSIQFLAMMLMASVTFAQVTFPVDFEAGAGSVTFTDFDGGYSQIISNPDATGINTSDYVAEHIRSGGEIWGGTYLMHDGAIDFTTNNTFSIKVWSPAADIPVLLKLENDSDPNTFVERSVNTTVANEWEELTFNFGVQSNDTYHNVIIIFNLGEVGDGSANSTYYFDDIEFFDDGSGNLEQIDLPITFDEPNVNYTLTDFGGASTVLGQNPDNADDTVAITTKTAGAETWAGTTMSSEAGLASAIPFTATETQITVSVYSPAAGVQVRLKAEDHTDPTLTAETEATTTAANTWEQLVFDFSNVAEGTNPFDPSTNFDKLSIFFDFGTAGAGDVYYWDDVVFGDGTGIMNPTLVRGEVYPNPVSSTFVVKGASVINDFNVYNVIGKSVTYEQVAPNKFDISNLTNGIYLYTFTNQNNEVVTGRIIKQ